MREGMVSEAPLVLAVEVDPQVLQTLFVAQATENVVELSLRGKLRVCANSRADIEISGSLQVG